MSAALVFLAIVQNFTKGVWITICACYACSKQ